MATSKHVADASERITDYIETLPDWSRKICLRLRNILLKSDPQILEDWKWGPSYYLEGMVCNYAAFQKHVALVFFKGSQLKDKRKLLKGYSYSLNNRHFKFKHVKDMDEDILLEYIMEAINNNKKGIKLKVTKDKTVPLASNIKKEFRSAGVLQYFESLAYSHKKEYVLWIEDAKKQETRINRIAKAISKLGEKQMAGHQSKKK